ncbi:Glycogen synthase kinase-3 beta [Haplosporangium sp. Z 11]|nr:Glycogen synthase kinase-3 beta [Haplosporangium sp. Z 11]
MAQSFPTGLIITAVGARDLAKRKRFGPQDPYLAFYIQGREKVTPAAVNGGVKPEWNHVIRYNHIHEASSKEESTLTVYCIHKQSGFKVVSGDVLIGICKIDLNRTLFASQLDVYDDWFQLWNDDKMSGQVHLRLERCEPTTEDEKPEDTPLRLDRKNRIVRSKAERKAEKKIGWEGFLSKATSASTSTAASSVSTLANNSTSSPVLRSSSAVSSSSSYDTKRPNGPIQRTSSSRIHRPRSMADLSERRPTIKFKEPLQRRMSSRSMEDVREMASNGMDGQNYNKVASPKQTFTLQDSDGNINQLKMLTASFDPNWLEPTPPILRRALSAQFYYDDIHNQMASNPRDLLPQSQSQRGRVGLHNGPLYAPIDGQPSTSQQHQYQQQSPLQVFPQGHGQTPSQLHLGTQQPMPMPMPMPMSESMPASIPMSMPMPMPMPSPDHHISPTLYPPQQLQQPQPQQPHSLGPSCTPPTILAPQPQQSWPPQQSNPYQPHTVFHPRQPSRSKLDMAGNSKFMSLPSRHHLPYQMQHLQSMDGGRESPSQVVPQNGMPNAQSPLTHGTTLGPAAGYFPETYSYQHQRALSSQLSQCVSAAQTQSPTSVMPAHPSEIERPCTSNCFHPPQTTSSSSTAQPSGPPTNQATDGNVQQPMYYSSPTPQEPRTYQQPARTGYNNPGTSVVSGSKSHNAMANSPEILPLTTSRIPNRAKEAIFSQYMPRPVDWDGKDIQESLTDSAMGRRILSRYAVGMMREKYVREGFYIKEKSPSFAVSQTVQQQQQQQERKQRKLQRQCTMDLEGNDRVILKYLKSKRDWEIDCVMMRYLTCQHPEERLESQYMDYPQPQQHCQFVNPFVVGLYETFLHPHGSDLEGCRYLSVLQWYPETLQGFIEDSIASGEGMEVTLPIVRSLIECVEWIHSRKICHLNIKPSNFVRDPYAANSMNPRGGVGWKLVDFDAARVIDEDTVSRCTFAYAAPELLIGNANSVVVVAKAAMDIWSLGLVIYELLTDQPLFRTDAHANDALLPKNARPPKQVRYYDCQNIDPKYHPLLDAMTAYDPVARPTAAQLLKMDIFTKPITPQPVTQDLLMRNNNILSLRDLKVTRLCNLQDGGSSATAVDQGMGQKSDGSSRGSLDSAYGSSSSPRQLMLLEGIGRILDSPFEQVPRLFMILPPMAQDVDPKHPFMPNDLFQNKSLRLVLLCEGLSGYGEDAHMTDHRGYILQDPSSFVRDVGKVLLHLVAVAGTNHPGHESPGLDRPLALTRTPLDNCQQWYPSLRAYYEVLQSAIQRQIGPAPLLNELRSLRGPTLKLLDQWLVRLVRQQCEIVSTAVLNRKPTMVSRGGMDEHSDYFGAVGMNGSALIPDVAEVTGPGGGEGYGGLYKMPVGTCGDRWICRGCVSKQMAMTAAAAPARSSVTPAPASVTVTMSASVP